MNSFELTSSCFLFQAIRGNMGDVSAKDGSQETCVNLVASFLGVFILSHIEDKLWYVLKKNRKILIFL